ncbi:MAG: serine/threonine-protein kinase [Streptosporangiales bacterium]|nr:serine/threonine-protein kinase [Streptosporangiales bacterium]
MAEELPTRRPGRRLTGPAEGETVGGYRLESRIGAGGMAVVFRARDERLDRLVALKVLTPALTLDEEFRERFIRESRAASVVDHPHIIPVYGAGEDDGVLYLAMRHVSGGDLHSVVEREGPLAPGRVAPLLSPVALALDAAHQAGIIHRDVKPANILIDAGPGRPDHPYLSDFGLAKRELATQLTAAGEFVGTAGFAAPEQIEGQSPRRESDQYALACVAFTMLTASLPFRHASVEAMLWAQMSQPPPKVMPHRPDLSPAVDDVITRGLARHPADRYPNCAAFADALHQALRQAPGGGTSVGSVPVPEPGPSPRRARRHDRKRRRTLIFASASVVVVAAAVLVGVRTVPHVLGPAPAKGPAGPRLVAKLAGDGAQAAAIAFGPDGTLKTVDQMDSVFTYDIATGRVRSKVSLGGDYYAGNATRFTLDGSVIVWPSGICGGGVPNSPCPYQLYRTAWKQASGQITVASPEASVGDFALVAPDQAGDGVGIWNLQSLSSIGTLPWPGQHAIEDTAVSPDATTVAAANGPAGGTHQIRVWNVASQSVTATLTVPRKMGSVWTVANPDYQAGIPMGLGGTTLVASDGITTDIYDLRSPARPATTVTGGAVALSPDGATLAATDPARPDTMDLWNTRTGKKTAALVMPDAEPQPASAAFSPDGKSFAVSCNDEHAYVWRIAGGGT